VALVRQCVCAPVCSAVRIARLQKARKAKERSSSPTPGLRSMMSGSFLGAYLVFLTFFFLTHRSHSISFTRAQGIPTYKIGFGRERMGELGRDWLRGFVLRAHTIAMYHTHSRSQGRICELESIC
jgi:hypothetical protein